VPEGAKIVEFLMGRDAVEGYSRQQFLRRGAVAAGGIAGSACSIRWRRSAVGGRPSPIPGGFARNFSLVTHDPFFHALPPATGSRCRRSPI